MRIQSPAPGFSIGIENEHPQRKRTPDEATSVTIRERESNDQIRVNMKRVAAVVNFDTQVHRTGQVLKWNLERKVLVTEAKFYSATAIIVGVSKIKAFGYVDICTIYSFRPKKLIGKSLEAAKQCVPRKFDVLM